VRIDDDDDDYDDGGSEKSQAQNRTNLADTLPSDGVVERLSGC
jgi:hypothetical protein